MGTIHLIGGEKGGVGKSTVARVLGQYLIDHGISFVAFDADTSHPSMLRHYAEEARSVSLGDSAAMDAIAEEALEPERRVLVDLPAQSAERLHGWIREADVLDLARENEVSLRHWHVTDGGYDSVRLLGALTALYSKDVAYVVVRNHGRSRDFSLLEESEELAGSRALGALVLDLPELDARVMHQIDRHGSSFWAAVNDEHSELRLSTLDRRRVRRWIQQAYGELDRLGDAL